MSQKTAYTSDEERRQNNDLIKFSQSMRLECLRFVQGARVMAGEDIIREAKKLYTFISNGE